MPSRISFAQEIAYLRTLGDTGNASLAAAQAGVSRDWAYKRRLADARFDALCREMVARFTDLPPALKPPRPSLSPPGRGDKRKRTQVRRDRAGGWTAAKEARFIERLRETCSVPLAAAAAGLSMVSAYRRRQVRPPFAEAWDEALRVGWPPADLPWIEAAECFFEGREPPPGNPVRFASVSEVIEAMNGNRFAPRQRRGRSAG